MGTGSQVHAPPAGGDTQTRSQIRDGMAIDWDVPIVMDDAVVLRADVFRPIEPGRYPVLMTYGPYGKGLAFQEGYKTCWDLIPSSLMFDSCCRPAIPSGSQV